MGDEATWEASLRAAGQPVILEGRGRRDLVLAEPGGGVVETALVVGVRNAPQISCVLDSSSQASDPFQKKSKNVHKLEMKRPLCWNSRTGV